MQKQQDVLSDQAHAATEARMGVEKTQSGNGVSQKTTKGPGQAQRRKAMQS